LLVNEPTRDPRLLSAERLAEIIRLQDWQGPKPGGACDDREWERGVWRKAVEDAAAHIAAQEAMLVAFRQAAVLDEKLIDIRSLLIECDSELSSQGHGRPPSPSEHLLDLSWRLRSAYDTRR
jgi:hypothetical protein